jgi:hypothetical protein
MGFDSVMDAYLQELIKEENPLLRSLVRAIPAAYKDELRQSLAIEEDLLSEEIERVEGKLHSLRVKVNAYKEARKILKVEVLEVED